MEYSVFVWIVLAAVCVASELASPGLFFFLSAAGGAVVALFFALYEYSLVYQVSFFVIATTFFCYMLYRCVKNFKIHHQQKTNISALIGMRVLVVDPISPYKPGAVKIYGDVWQAVEVHGNSVAAESFVEVVAVRGVHVIVKIVSK